MAPSTTSSYSQRTGPAVAMAAGGILTFMLLPAVMLGHVAAQQYTYTVQVNTNYPFNDIRPSDGPMNAPTCGDLAYGDTSPTACEMRCNAADACVGFVHVADVNCCFLKSKLEGQNANPSCVTHLKTGSPGNVVATLPYTYTVQPDTNYWGNDIHPSDGPINAPACGDLAYSESPTACEARCNAAAGCAGFVHVADVNCCFLKGKLEAQSANTACVTHLKTGLPGYVVAYGKDNPGNDIFPPAGAPTNAALCGDVATVESIGACIARCDNAAACAGIAHCADYDCCYLKSTLGPENANTRVAMLRKTALATPTPTTPLPTTPLPTTPPPTTPLPTTPPPTTPPPTTPPPTTPPPTTPPPTTPPPTKPPPAQPASTAPPTNSGGSGGGGSRPGGKQLA